MLLRKAYCLFGVLFLLVVCFDCFSMNRSGCKDCVGCGKKRTVLPLPEMNKHNKKHYYGCAYCSCAQRSSELFKKLKKRELDWNDLNKCEKTHLTRFKLDGNTNILLELLFCFKYLSKNVCDISTAVCIAKYSPHLLKERNSAGYTAARFIISLDLAEYFKDDSGKALYDFDKLKKGARAQGNKHRAEKIEEFLEAYPCV